LCAVYAGLDEVLVVGGLVLEGLFAALLYGEGVVLVVTLGEFDD